ncbi:MAG: TetR/AcrR family transcriptional regulator [Wenzhouxiangella sp.]|jgi:TetR/AcrR family transcriptional regulator|nr:TetR/AcrR family transcriptional regulator [Wenzhouxiangella sp.]
MNQPLTRDAELTRSRILEAAFELFVDRGFAAVSMRELAVRSDVTKSLIHHHFGTKEALWEAVKEMAFGPYYEQQHAELTEAEQPGAELLVRGARNYFEFLRENPKVARLFAWAHLEGDKSCSQMDATLVGLGSERVAQAQASGALRDDINPTHVVTMFISLFTQWFEAREHHQAWPGIGDDQEFLDDFLKVFMEGLLPRSPSS